MMDRAKKFQERLRDAGSIPVELDVSNEMVLPEFANPIMIQRAQQCFTDNFFSMMFGMYVGLLAILAIPSILNVLVHTKKSSSPVTAYKRYMQTIFHTLVWFRYELKSGTKSWKSIEAVRKFHFSASRSAKNADVGMISQKDLAITQFGFMGFIVKNKKQLGVHCNDNDIEAFIHFWRVLGKLIGIRDEYNLCTDSLEETFERLEIVRTLFLKPSLQFPPEKFEEMTKHVVEGMWCFNPLDDYIPTIFFTKRICGVPGFEYLDNEIADSSNDQELQYKKLSWYSRWGVYSSMIIHEHLLQFSPIRWFFNIETLFHEFLIRYFPFLAFFKFGFKNAYVKILGKED